MQYRTIIHQLLQDRPEIHDQLRKNRTLLSTLEIGARQLKTRHEEWKGLLAKAKPGSDDMQIASEALEIALEELENRLSSGSLLDEPTPLSLKDAMAYIRGQTPPA